MSVGRCSECRRLGEMCWHCKRTCTRKKRFHSYDQGKELRDLLRARAEDGDPTLEVYSCGDHWHVGHATGQRARALLKRAEKLRRKKLIADLTVVVDTTETIG